MDSSPATHPFLQTPDEVAQRFNTNIENGLTTAQVIELRKICKRNELEVAGAVKWYRVLGRQLVHPMNLASMVRSIAVSSCH
jgi:hypothetical protein